MICYPQVGQRNIKSTWGISMSRKGKIKPEEKVLIVEKYIRGKIGICEAARLSRCSKDSVEAWVRIYEEMGSTGLLDQVHNWSERLMIVRECLDNDKNYGTIVLKYNRSYQQVRNWVIRYEKMGVPGLEDRRGRRIGSQASHTLDEKLCDKIAELERKNEDLQWNIIRNIY